MIYTNKIMPVENFLERMNVLLEELKAHPKITLLNYYVPAPATEQDFAEVESHIGFPLPEDIKAFYRQCNGLQLRWVHKDNWNVDQKIWKEFMEGPFDYEETTIERGIEGVVHILGVREVFFRQLPFQKKALRERELNMTYLINGESLTFRELEPFIWNFDLFSASFDFGLMFLGTTLKVTPLLLISMGHRFPSLGGSILKISDYLDLILLKKGCADARTFQFLPKEIDYNSSVINDMDGLLEIGDPTPYDLNYPYHRKK